MYSLFKRYIDYSLVKYENNSLGLNFPVIECSSSFLNLKNKLYINIIIELKWNEYV